MFNALNRYLSRLDGDTRPQQHESHGAGFQVLRNTNLELGIEPWFDFIVGINGRMIDNPDPALFAQEVRNCAGSTVSLGVWSAKGQRIRPLHIPVPATTGSLGLSLQWGPLSLASTIWHVLDVPANSPADTAGLLPYSDYIIGTPEAELHGESALGEIVDDYIGRPLRLWVYNNEYDVTRELEIVPSRDWGGDGAVGCVLGFGALHRLPPPLHEPVSAPGETLFESGGSGGSGYGAPNAPNEQFTTLSSPLSDPYNNNNLNNTNSSNTFTPIADQQASQAQGAGFLVPAQMVATPPPPSAGGSGGSGGAAPPPRGKKKERHGPNRLMDDYLAEEEKKSRALDGNISANRTPPPPPPKAGAGAGGPPRASSGAAPPPTSGEVQNVEGGGEEGEGGGGDLPAALHEDLTGGVD